MTLANSYHMRGRLLHILGDKAKVNSSEEAYRFEKEAMALRDVIDYPNIYGVAASWGQLAIWALATKEYQQSLEYSQKCLDIRLAEFPGEEVENLAVTYMNIGRAFMFLGRLDEAEKSQREAVAVIEQKFGAESVSVAQ